MTILTPLYQRIFVRFARKPIWMPTAPSKLFRIPEHKFYSDDESKEIFQLQVAYRAQEVSIGEFMRHQFYVPATQTGGLPSEFIEREQKIDEKLRQENDKENARIAELKEQFLTNRLKEWEEKLTEEKRLKEQKLAEIATRVDEYIRKRKADPDSFVTPENIDSQIEMAIENPVSFEFCIDTRGKRYAPQSGQPELGQPVNEVINKSSSSSSNGSQ